MKRKITRNAILSEILEKRGAEKILTKYNLPCLWCPMAKYEIQTLTIGQVCKKYGIDIDKLLKELNDLLSKKK